ncbi:unnamed protein product [Moneuplotes crassus]|uniref:Uncharacterized protein n=1 Tax=Euplotes crassus TaxID=5936 RepID=A0AAD1XMA9_EUPCR|nr:unnamed protein product [Moneuplotes crassus]
MINKTFRLNSFKDKRSVNSPIQGLTFSSPSKRTPIPISDKVKLIRRVDYYKQCSREELMPRKRECLSMDRERTFTPQKISPPIKFKCRRRRLVLSNEGRLKEIRNTRFLSPTSKQLHVNMSKFIRNKMKSMKFQNGRLISPNKLRNKVHVISRMNRAIKNLDLRGINATLPRLDNS